MIKIMDFKIVRFETLNLIVDIYRIWQRDRRVFNDIDMRDTCPNLLSNQPECSISGRNWRLSNVFP